MYFQATLKVNAIMSWNAHVVAFMSVSEQCPCQLHPSRNPCRCWLWWLQKRGCQHCLLRRGGQINIHTLLPTCDTWVVKSTSTFQKQYHPILPLLLKRNHLKAPFSWSSKVSREKKEKIWGFWDYDFLVLKGNAREAKRGFWRVSSSVQMWLQHVKKALRGNIILS